VLIDKAAEPNSGDRRGHQEDSGDHACCQHRLGFQEDPESDGEPDGEVDDRHEQCVDQQMDERSIAAPAEVQRTGRGRGHEKLLVGRSFQY
jgi:hypothetical protein